jgi:hypothetical protein
MIGGIGKIHAFAVGAGSALGAPLWVRGRRFERLLDRAGGPEVDSPSSSGIVGTDPLPGRIVFAMRIARALLRRLAWPPLSPWRNTCLYRSIAECNVLRRYGVPAAIRLGVRNEDPPHGPIVAHAWVVYPGATATATHVPLAPVSGAPSAEGAAGELAVPRSGRMAVIADRVGTGPVA